MKEYLDIILTLLRCKNYGGLAKSWTNHLSTIACIAADISDSLIRHPMPSSCIPHPNVLRQSKPIPT